MRFWTRVDPQKKREGEQEKGQCTEIDQEVNSPPCFTDGDCACLPAPPISCDGALASTVDTSFCMVDALQECSYQSVCGR